MSKLVVQSIEGPDDNANRFPDGLSVTGITTLASAGGITTTGGTLYAPQLSVSGVITATSFSGSGASLTGIDGGIAGVSTTGFSTFRDVKHAGITTCVGIVSCSDVVSTGIVTAKAFIPTQGHLSNRNWVINGSFQVAQRGTTTTTTGFQTVDRWFVNWGGTDESPTVAQVTLTSSDTGPWAKGFRNALQITNGNQTGGAGAGDDITIQTKLEAQNIANSGWDYTNTSSYITLQFWVKSSIAQNFYGRIASNDGTAKSYPFQTGSLSANTWTKVTKTIPGHADLQFDNNTGTGFIFILPPFLGTNFTASGASVDTWATFDSAERTPDSTSTWYTTNDSTYAITGVQIEVGQAPTPFEHRSYADDLLACFRYYYRIKSLSNGDDFATGFNTNTTNCRPTIIFPVRMRSEVTGVDQSGTATDYMVAHGTSETQCSSVPTISGGSEYNCRLVFHVSSGLTAGQGSAGRAYNSSAYLGFSAEL